MEKSFSISGWFFIFMSVAAVSFCQTEAPLEVIRLSNQQILDIYAAHEQIAGEEEDEIFRIMNRVTDFEKISGITIMTFCEKLSPEECEEFDRVFQKLLHISSIKKLGRYRADRFDYLGEKVDGETAVVRTIAYYKEDEIRLDYYLERMNGAWMIVNYVSDDVDTIRNYKKQFSRILRKESFRQLIDRLERKIADYENEDDVD